MDGFQYKDGVLQFFPTTEGYVNAITAGSVAYNYVYNLTDHLGNVRVNYAWDDVNSKLKTVNEDHYYPFGLQHKGYNKPPVDITIRERERVEIGVGIGNTSGSANYKYRYNGKELQEELNLNLYDYGARNYDPAIGRFFNIDRFAEKYTTTTPYHYTKNNPIYFVDFKGDSLIINSASDRAGLITRSFQGMVNKGLGGFYKLNVDTNGKTSLTSTGKKGEMNAQQQAFYNIFEKAISNSETMTISLVESDNSVEIGSYDTGEIDVADISKLGNSDLSSKEYISAQGAIAHEIEEQYDKQIKKSNNQIQSHRNGVISENVVNGSIRAESQAVGFTTTNGEKGTILKSTTTIGTASKKVDIYIYNGNVINKTKIYE
ncbi:RHS repeat domain-containing protein [Empedobacter brevis]|uniref:RHS repeat domain-containing protein n=1 Tax=Empedobacter brevis TaxID=247 RepID=UPI0023F1CB73|nr:RHS repeat-associated core domain-containing protein [Empedobacter brevis]